MSQLSSQEKISISYICLVYATRMLGLFILFPVFVIFAKNEFPNASGFQIGLALGAYGFSQALLQIPFGIISDYTSRRLVLIIGLMLFFLGSIMCFLANTIELMIIGRVIQGAGAISAVLIALIGDTISEDNHMKSMALIGVTIGASFILSLVSGPLIADWFGARALFAIVAFLTILNILAILLIPQSQKNRNKQKIFTSKTIILDLFKIISSMQLFRINFGILVLHVSLTSTFLILPKMLVDQYNLNLYEHWKFYISIFPISFLIVMPLIYFAENKQKIKPIFILSLMLLSLSFFLLLSDKINELIYLALVFVIYFVGFNFLESTLPTLTLRFTPIDKKGFATGIFSSFQFFGAAIGGVVGGFTLDYYGATGVYILNSILIAIWLLLSLPLKITGRQTTMALDLKRYKVAASKKTEFEQFITQVMQQFDSIDQFKIDKKNSYFYIRFNPKKIQFSQIRNKLEQKLKQEKYI